MRNKDGGEVSLAMKSLLKPGEYLKHFSRSKGDQYAT